MKQTPDIVWPAGYEKAKRAAERAEQRLAAAKDKLEAQKKLALIKCAKCSVEYPISTQEYIQTHWYVSPYSCNGGAYWNSGEANWRCPSCGFKNRFDDEKDKYQTMANDFYRPELVGVKRYFASIRECYCEWNSRLCEACRKVAAA